MSSKQVRSEIKDFLNANWSSTPIYDLSDFFNVDDLPSNLDSWLGIQFIGGVEDLREIGATCYRERGLIFFHVVVESGFNSDKALGLCEELRNILRSVRINDLVIEQVKPPTDNEGKALYFSGNWHGWLVESIYYFDIDK
jgi:hypothetical protein